MPPRGIRSQRRAGRGVPASRTAAPAGMDPSRPPAAAGTADGGGCRHGGGTDEGPRGAATGGRGCTSGGDGDGVAADVVDRQARVGARQRGVAHRGQAEGAGELGAGVAGPRGRGQHLHHDHGVRGLHRVVVEAGAAAHRGVGLAGGRVVDARRHAVGEDLAREALGPDGVRQGSGDGGLGPRVACPLGRHGARLVRGELAGALGSVHGPDEERAGAPAQGRGAGHGRLSDRPHHGAWPGRRSRSERPRGPPADLGIGSVAFRRIAGRSSRGTDGARSPSSDEPGRGRR